MKVSYLILQMKDYYCHFAFKGGELILWNLHLSVCFLIVVVRTCFVFLLIRPGVLFLFHFSIFTSLLFSPFCKLCFMC